MSMTSAPSWIDLLRASAASWQSGHPSHTVQFYGDDTFLHDELARYIGAALLAGDAALVIDFASAARRYVEGFAQRTEIKVNLNVPEDFDRMLDAVELGRFHVLREDLTNGRRHSGASQATVSIRKDDTSVVLEFSDTGGGMPEELLMRFRATGTGIGVGLANIEKRTREMGGTLQLESDRKGTSIWVVMPLAKTVRKQPHDDSGSGPPIGTA